MVKITSCVDNARCCLTCESSQWPDGDGVGVCFETKHNSASTLTVREFNVCQFWRGFTEVDHTPSPHSINEQILAVLVSSWGKAPRSALEIRDRIEVLFERSLSMPDIGRLLDHLYSHGTIRTSFGSTSLAGLATWQGRYERILKQGDGSLVRFEPSVVGGESFRKKFGRWLLTVRP